MNLEKSIYTTREVAQLVGVAPNAIATAIREGRLKAEKFGTSYAIERDNLEEYLEGRKVRRYGGQ